MIILDREDQDQTKLELDVFNGSTIRLPEATVNRSSTSLPDYFTSQLQHTVTPEAPKRRFNRKKWRTAAYTLAVYIVLTVVIGVPITVTRLRQKAEARSTWVPPPSWNAPVSSSSSTGSLLTVMQNVQDCNGYNQTSANNGTFFATLTRNFAIFDTFAIESDYQYNISDSRPLFGKLRIDPNPDKSIQELQLIVKVQASSLDVLNGTQFCFINELSGRGLQIGVPTDLQQDDRLEMLITLLLPNKGLTPPMTRITRFATYLPLFHQDYGLLWNYNFADVRIEGPLSNITIGMLQGEKVAIKSSLAPIQGTFNITRSLSLDTIGSPITVDATLTPSDSYTPVSLTGTTGNGEIKAHITLQPPPGDTDMSGDQQTFIAELSSLNGPINVNVTHSPTSKPSNLFLRVQNNLGPATVSLDRKFIGTFDVQTKLAPVTITGTERRQKGVDLGVGSFYTIDSAERSYGWAGLGAMPSAALLAKYGHVEVTSSMSPVALSIEGVEEAHKEVPP